MYSVQLWMTNVVSTTVEDKGIQYNCGRRMYSVQLWKTNVFNTTVEDECIQYKFGRHYSLSGILLQELSKCVIRYCF